MFCRKTGRIKNVIFFFSKFRPAGPDQIISTIGNTTVWKRQRIGVWQGRLTLTGLRGTDGLGERMFLQLQSEDEAAVSVGLAHIGNEVSQGVDYDVLFGTVGT